MPPTSSSSLLADVNDVTERTIAAQRWVVILCWLFGAAMLGLCIAMALTNLWARNGAGYVLVPKDQPGAVGVRLNPGVLVAFGLAFAFNALRTARVRVVIAVDRVTIVNPYRRYVIARSEIIGVDLGRGHVYVVTTSGRRRVALEDLAGRGKRDRRADKLADALGVAHVPAVACR